MAAVAPASSIGEDVMEDDEQRVCLFSSASTVCSTQSQEIRLMKQRVAEMEMEAKKLREMQAAAEETTTGEDATMETEEEKALSDTRSVYVGNVSQIALSLSELWH